jgi:hypothetical protein
MPARNRVKCWPCRRTNLQRSAVTPEIDCLASCSVSGCGCRFCGGWILITWCLARSLAAAFGLAFMRFVGIR